MVGSSSGPRILKKSNPYFSNGAKVLGFVREPNGLKFVSVSGMGPTPFGFGLDMWSAPGFWQARIHPDERDAVLEHYLECARDGVDHELEYRIIDATGRKRWVYEISGPDLDANAPQAIRGYLLDITARVALEADVRHALHLHDTLMRLLAADLGEPVKTISAYGDMLERHLSAQRDDVGSDFALGIREAVERLSDVLANLREHGVREAVSFEELSRRLAALQGNGLRA